MWPLACCWYLVDLDVETLVQSGRVGRDVRHDLLDGLSLARSRLAAHHHALRMLGDLQALQGCSCRPEHVRFGVRACAYFPVATVILLTK